MWCSLGHGRKFIKDGPFNAFFLKQNVGPMYIKILDILHQVTWSLLQCTVQEPDSCVFVTFLMFTMENELCTSSPFQSTTRGGDSNNTAFSAHIEH